MPQRLGTRQDISHLYSRLRRQTIVSQEGSKIKHAQRRYALHCCTRKQLNMNSGRRTVYRKLRKSRGCHVTALQIVFHARRTKLLRPTAWTRSRCHIYPAQVSGYLRTMTDVANSLSLQQRVLDCIPESNMKTHQIAVLDHHAQHSHSFSRLLLSAVQNTGSHFDLRRSPDITPSIF